MSTSTPEQSFADVLDQIYFSSQRDAQGAIKDKVAHGTKFELFVQKFLKEDHKYADLFSDVWLWNEWPERGSRTDTGADLIAKERYSESVWAIQAKFYDPEVTLQKSHVDSFFTELGRNEYSNGMIISTAGKVSSQLEKSLAAQSKQVQLIGLEQFGESTIDWGAFDYAHPQHMVTLPGKQPRKYQRNAIDDVISGFKTNDRGKLIMACGTGKTFTSLQIVQELLPERESCSLPRSFNRFAPADAQLMDLAGDRSATSARRLFRFHRWNTKPDRGRSGTRTRISSVHGSTETHHSLQRRSVAESRHCRLLDLSIHRCNPSGATRRLPRVRSRGLRRGASHHWTLAARRR